MKVSKLKTSKEEFMREIILSRAEVATYISNHNLQETAPKKETEVNGLKYTQFSMEEKLSPLSRIVKIVLAVVCTILTLGLALFAKTVRDLYSEGLSGRATVLIYARLPALEAYMRVLTTSSGYIGTKSEETDWPKYWAHMTLENGDPLPLDPMDFIVKVQLLDPLQPLPDGLETAIFLPYQVLKKVKSGEKLNLLYKGQLIEFEARQITNQGVKPFEQYVKGVKAAFKNNERTTLETISYFSMAKPNDLFFYTLKGGGSILTLDLSETESTHPRRKDRQVVQELEQNEHFAIETCFAKVGEEGKFVIRAEVPGTDKVEILVNSKFIVLSYNNSFFGGQVKKVRWDIMEGLKNRTIKEIEQALVSAQVSYEGGIVTLKAQV